MKILEILKSMPKKQLLLLLLIIFIVLVIVSSFLNNRTEYVWNGQNLASEASFRCALYAALDIYRNRARYRAATANPLRKQYFEKGSDNEKLDLTKEEED